MEYIRSLAAEKQATPAQISLAWMISKKPYIVPIPGSGKVERIRENAGAAEIMFGTVQIAANGAVWEIGLKGFEAELKKEKITIYIVPLKEGVNVNVESSMAARTEEVESCTAELKSARLQPVYEIKIG